jgi:hypothetical protein
MVRKRYLDETKAQRRARKNKEKKVKEQSSPSLVPAPVPDKQKYVVCLKHGTKYESMYVNKLHSMVSKHLTIDHKFICFTEDTRDLDPVIEVRDLPKVPGMQGWWYKPMFFNPALGLDGTILFLDLDLIIFKNIDKLFTYMPGEFCIIRDFNRHIIRGHDKFNSSVFRLDTGQHQKVYTEFMNSANMRRRFHGDQDLMRYVIKQDYTYWPDEWIQSYKWEMRGKPRMIRDKHGKRNFDSPGEPKILDQTSIAVFHGDPNPHDCIDEWPKKHWG